MHLDGSGTIVGGNESRYHDFTDFVDERAVDIATDNNGNYYITALGRGHLGGGNDRILVLQVDQAGTLLNHYGISVNNNAQSLYPLHSLWHSNGTLYICGYMTLNNTQMPSEPRFTGYGQKRGFVLQFDVANNTVLNTFWVSHDFTAQNAATDDYDMAMRLVEMQSGDVFVTGSVNSVMSMSGTESYHSATMNIGLSQALSIPPLHDEPFALGSETWAGVDEYGVGMVEGNADGNFIISNRFNRYRGGSGFDEFIPYFMDITAVNKTGFVPDVVGGNNTRLIFRGYDYAWALQTLPHPGVPDGGHETRFVVAGMETNTWCQSTIPYPLPNGFDNIRPFLFDVSLTYDLSSSLDLQYTPITWTHYLNQTGTGSAGSANSYFSLGGGLSYIAWNPTFAAVNGDMNAIYMSAPKWSFSGNNMLSLKTIGVDYTFQEPTCADSWYPEDFSGIGGSCADPSRFDLWSVGSTDWPGNPRIKNYGDFIVTLDNPGVSDDEFLPDAELLCYISNNVYKPASIGKPGATANATIVYPNPATDEFYISLAGNIVGDAKIEVVLVNIYGQAVQMLYNGNAGGLKADTRLALPQVAAGIYLVRIMADGQLQHQQKLSIAK